MGFGEAVKVLAAEAGLIPYKFSNFDEKKEKKFKNYKNIYTDYSDFFYSELFKNNEVINYLKKRGLSKQTVKEFALGYVPWKNNFYETLLKKYTEDEINSTGLYYKNDKTGKYIDRFNSRIIFPVRNLSGDIIAFGGRIIKESKMAKYINSPETDFYKKGNMLFNLDKAKSMRSETDQIIIVEGYMDVISLYSSGIKNVVSNSGTALTENQIELIWKFFSEPVVCLDGDESGRKAASRIAERLLPLINENNKIYFSMLPNGEDPDDFIRKNGKLNFLKLLDQKKIIQLYIWDLYSSNLDKNDPFAISKFEKEIKKKCYAIKDETLKKYILEDFLERIKNLTPLQNFKKNFKKYKTYNKNNFKLLNETKVLHLQKNHLNREQLKEYSVLFIMLNYKSIAESRTEELSEINFSTGESEELKNLIIKYLSGGLEKEDYKNKINKNFENLIKEIEKNSNLTNIMNKKEISEKQELLDELMQDLKEMNHFKRIEFLEGEAAKNLDESSYSELMKLKSQLNGE